jgi:transcription antitermination factor NusG
MTCHIKKGDIVEIIAGDHKGATGRVLRLHGGIRREVGSVLSNPYILVMFCR